MGRHDAGRMSRGTPTSRAGSAFSPGEGDVEAVRSPTAGGGWEPRLLRQVLWLAVALTAGTFLLLLLMGGGSRWSWGPSGAEVVITPGMGEPGAMRDSSLPDNKPEDNNKPRPPVLSTADSPSKDDSDTTADPEPKDVPLLNGWQWDAYHNYSTSAAFLEWLQKSYPHLVTLSVVGKSAEGLNISAVEITSSSKASKTYKPMFKWLGGMHGNEMPSVELIMHFAYYLASEYGKQERVTTLLQSVRVQILPCLNQDGRQSHKRNNHNNKDLNRNFPMDTFNYKPDPTGVVKSIAIQDWRDMGYGPPEPETKVAMSWYEKNSPTFLSANVHGGALVANYPLDACDDMAQAAPCTTEEGDLPLFLAQVYSANHPTMHLSREERFENGTINGAVWYPVVGSLQDWVYHATKGMHLTMELHRRHTEPEAMLLPMWDENLGSLMRFTEMSHLGLLLWVVDNSTNTFLPASIRVLSPAKIREPNAFTDQNGHPAQFKLMRPDTEYCLEVTPKAGGGSRKQLSAKAYPKVLVGAKLAATAEDTIHGKTLSGMRIEYTLRVDPGSNERTVLAGAATSAACKNV